MARRSILSQLFRQSAGYVLLFQSEAGNVPRFIRFKRLETVEEQSEESGSLLTHFYREHEKSRFEIFLIKIFVVAWGTKILKCFRLA